MEHAAAASALGAPLIPVEELDRRGLELKIASGAHWPLQPDFLSRAGLVQKLARFQQARGVYVIAPLLPEVLTSIVAASQWPSCPAGLQAWTQACDFLLLPLRPHELAFAITAALRPWNIEASYLLQDCSTFGALQHTRRVKQNEELLRLLPLRMSTASALVAAPSLALNDPYDDEDGAAPVVRFVAAVGKADGKADGKAEAEILQPLLRSLHASELAERGLTSVEALRCLYNCCNSQQVAAASAEAASAEGVPDPQADAGLFARAPCVLHGAIMTLTQTLVGLTNTTRGSLHLLSLAAELSATYGPAVTQRLVHRCFCCLYVAESLQGVAVEPRAPAESAVCLPLSLVHTLQGLYRGALSLSCFLPLQQPPFCHLLPGLRHASEVAPLLPSEGELFAELATLVPWLPEALAGPVPLHLTGSLLSWASSRSREAPVPSDVDLFCEAAEDLDRAREQVARAMQRWAPGSLLFTFAPNHRRRKLRLREGRAEEGQQLPGISCAPPYQRCCDLYVNSLARVQQHHLPQVRASLSLSAGGGVTLRLSASAAIAWITMVNIDYNAFRGAKTPFQIVANRWLWGFNFCLSHREVVAMTTFLRCHHPAEYSRAVLLNRRQRLWLQRPVVLQLSAGFEL